MFLTWVLAKTKPEHDVYEADRVKPSATLTSAPAWTILAGALSRLRGFMADVRPRSSVWSNPYLAPAKVTSYNLPKISLYYCPVSAQWRLSFHVGGHTLVF